MHRTAEILISAGTALLAVIFYGVGNYTQTINPDDPGPGFFPRTLCVLLLIFSVTQVILSWLKKRDERGKGKAIAETGGFSYRMFFGTLLLSILYGLVFDKVSYLVTTTCFLVAMMLLGGVRKWTILVSVALSYSAATYYLFGKVLMVALK